MSDVRPTIIAQFAEWTALSALRSGAPITSRRDVYSAIHRVDFAPLFDDDLGPIRVPEFDAWHFAAITEPIRGEPRLTVGLASKIVNVYLTTRCYIAAQGRPQLNEAIHPPMDAGLWLGIRRRFIGRNDILGRSNCVERIKDIVDYDCYGRIIDGCVRPRENLIARSSRSNNYGRARRSLRHWSV